MPQVRKRSIAHSTVEGNINMPGTPASPGARAKGQGFQTVRQAERAGLHPARTGNALKAKELAKEARGGKGQAAECSLTSKKIFATGFWGSMPGKDKN